MINHKFNHIFIRFEMKSVGITIYFFCLILLQLLTANADAEIFVHDHIAAKDEGMLLKAEIGGRFVRKGGELVEFFVDRKSIGKALSGGDGFAFKQFSSSRVGILKVTVKSPSDESTGLLLNLKKGTKIVFTDIEGGLMEGNLLRQMTRDGSQEAIREISKKYPVVILQAGILNKKMAKKWLEKHGFGELPVIAWHSGQIFQELREKGMVIKAVIGSDAIIDSAIQYKPLSFSFKGKEGAQEVKNWDEVRKRLLK